MSMLKKAMIYLGLGPDENFDNRDDLTGAPTAAGVTTRYPAARAGSMDSYGAQPGSLAAGAPLANVGRTVRPVQTGPVERPQAAVSPDQSAPSRIVRPGERKSSQPHAVSPESFDDAQQIADRYKSGQPVILNLDALDRDLRRRLIDFSAGLCYAIGGKIERVTDRVYLLVHPGEVDAARTPLGHKKS